MGSARSSIKVILRQESDWIGDHPNLFKVDVRSAAAAADGVQFVPLPSIEFIPELAPGA